MAERQPNPWKRRWICPACGVYVTDSEGFGYYLMLHGGVCNKCGKIFDFGIGCHLVCVTQRWVWQGIWWNPWTWKNGYWEDKPNES